MRTLGVIPPMVLDARQRSLWYVINNALMEDLMEESRERQYINIWLAQEKQIYKEKYLQHPKNFALISLFLEKKVSHCLMVIISWFIFVYYIFSSDLLRFISELLSIIHRVNYFILNVFTS